MRNAKLVTLTVMAIAIAFALGACTQPAPPTPPTVEPSAPPSQAEPAPTEVPAPSTPGGKTTYKVDAVESSIGWSATVPIGTRYGGFAQFEGTVEVEGENFETAKIDGKVEMKSVFSDAAELTEKLKGEDHFFNPVKFPISTFKSTSIKKNGDKYDITGDLTIRDKTKSVTFPTTVEFKDGNLHATTEVDLNRHDFDITYQSAIGDYVIQDMAQLTLEIVATPQ